MINIPLVPQQPDGALRIIVMGRLSQPKETEEETQQTINSSFAYAEEFIRKNYDGEVEFRFLGEQVSGLVVDRRTILEAMELMETGNWDVLISEDLGRVYRNPRHQYAFVQDCVDLGVRLICVADMLDTADENWETMLGAAALRHGLFVPDTRRRIKRSAKYAFHKGGMVQKVKFGYRKLTREQAASGEYGPKDLRIARLPEHQWVFDKMRELLMKTQSPVRVADWLNDNKVPTGPYVKRGYWNVPILQGLLTDPQIHGTRTFRKVVHRPILRTGKYRRERNPSPETEYVSDLAFMSLDEQERMLASVGWKIRWGGGVAKSDHPLKGKSRNRVPWPNQAATCSVCGGAMLRVGDFLKCSNSRQANGGTCWNHVQAPVDLINEQTLSWLRDMLCEDPVAHDAMVDAAFQALQQSQAQASAELKGLQREIDSLVAQQRNLAKAIAEGGELSSLLGLLKSVEAQLSRAQVQQDGESSAAALPACMSKGEVSESLSYVLASLIRSSVELGDVMREFFTEFVICPVQALDSGQVHPRAVLRYRVDEHARQDGPPTVAEATFDLFLPPVHIRLMPAVVALRKSQPKPTYRQIAPVISTSYMTVKRALRYAALMEEKGLVEPFLVLTEKPTNASRWRHAS